MEAEDRIKKLEQEFGVIEEREPTTCEEFIEQYPDYEELIEYISPEEREMLSKYGAVLPSFEGWSEVKIQRAKRCSEYYYKLHPEGIRGKEILDRYVYGGGWGISLH